MSTRPHRHGTPGSVPFDIKDRTAFRRLDAIDGPARPLSDKRASLHARRKRTNRDTSTAHAKPPAMSDVGRTVASDDATLTFSIVRLRKGVLVRRAHCPVSGPRIVQVMKFESIERFDRWCTSEPVRFDDPLLYGELSREGHDALGRAT